MTIDEARKSIGRGVVYMPGKAWGNEEGVITSVNDAWVFVRYRGQFPGSPGQATKPEDIEFSGARKP
jgi:hypothetical protein